MKVHKVIQGSPEWLQLRATAFTASEAPAMMGCSPYMTRTELLRLKHTGLAAEVNAATQRLFDNGHATEAQFRPIAEDIISDDLYPVTGSIELDGMLLLASFDGLTMDYSIGFEHKLWSETNAAVIEMEGEPPIYHCWQMEHQMLVSGAQEILFATSDGTAEKSLVCRYRSKPERRAALIAGWKQFAADLAAYVPSTVSADKPTGKAPDTLPALRIEVTGMVTASNLAEFKETALAAIRGVNRDLATDQDFADAEQSVKWCEEVETRLKAAKEHALSQTASIDQLFKTIDDISAEARKVRLELDKLVKARKDELRQQIVTDALRKLDEHFAKLSQRIGLRIGVQSDFPGVIKGKRSLASMQDAVDTELARAKIAANEIADVVEANIKSLKGEAHDWSFLFPDLRQVAGKPAEDFANLLAARIAAHKQAEEQRKAREAEAAAKAAQVVQQAAAPAVSKPAPVAPEAPAATSSTIKLGKINACLAPIQITQAGLSQLGFDPVGKEGAAVLYRESDFPAMCQAIAKHVMGAVALA
jgi:putative phage-type endonuclease